MAAPKRNVHLHLVDISAGWHLGRSLTVDEFMESRQVRIYADDDEPLDDLIELEIASEHFLLDASDVELDNEHESAATGFLLFARLLAAREGMDVEPHSVGPAGDWLLAVARPRDEYSSAVVLMVDCIARDDFVPLNGDALVLAVQSMLARALPCDGFTVEMMQVHKRWTPALPKMLV